MDEGLVCCMFFFVVFFVVIGVLCFYYGNKCKNVELRVEYKNGLCKNIYNDELVIVL